MCVVLSTLLAVLDILTRQAISFSMYYFENKHKIASGKTSQFVPNFAILIMCPIDAIQRTAEAISIFRARFADWLLELTGHYETKVFLSCFNRRKKTHQGRYTCFYELVEEIDGTTVP